MEPKTGVDPRSLLEHKDFVRGVVRGLLADEHAIDDVVQEACLRAIERPPRHAALRAWLARVGRNLALTALRAQRRRDHREQAAARPERQPSASEAASRLERHRLVVEAVLALEEPFRSAILLRFYEDLPPREIARQLGVPVDTVRSRLRRGLERLRAWFDERHGGDRAAWSLALLPLLGARGAAALGAAATGGGTKVLLVKGAIMSAKTKLVGAAIVVCALGTGTIVWQHAKERDHPPAPRAEVARGVVPPEREDAQPEGAPGFVPDGDLRPSAPETHTATVNAEVKIDGEHPKPVPKPYRLAEPCGESDLGALRVIVTDGMGNPFPGAKVTAGIVRGENSKPTSYEAGGDGRLELRSLEPGKWSVSGMALSQRRFATVEVEAGRFTEIGIALAGGAAVEGEVRHVERGPLPDLIVNFSRNNDDGFTDSFWATTDAQGRYRLEGVPPGKYQGSVQGKFVGFGYRSPPLATLEVQGPGPMTWDIVLGRIKLRGTVRDADTGAPIAGVMIQFRHGPNTEVATDGDGAYAVPDLLPGSYKVILTRDGYGSEFGDTGKVPAEGTLTADFTLRKAAVLVLEVLDSDGRPISGGVGLSLLRKRHKGSLVADPATNTGVYRGTMVPEPPIPGASVETDSMGVGRYPRIVPGFYDIGVGAEGYRHQTQFAEIKPGEHRLTFRLEHDSAPRGGRISLQGVVRESETGRPIPNACVSAQMAGVLCSTDAEGRYGLRDVPPGKWTVAVTKDGYGARVLKEVEFGSEPRTLDAELDPAATLHLHVTDAAGRPVVGSVHLSMQGSRDGKPTNVGTGVKADALGHAIYRRILPGRYLLRVMKEGVGEGKAETVITLGENVVRVRLE